MFSKKGLEVIKKTNGDSEMISGLVEQIEELQKRLSYAHRFAKRDELYDADYIEKVLNE